ncbi:MAG TPA: murein biosynthesis integral membrane protein MurJ [candidate division Zixibacteria bacterium]|nr:murein biosynthesis integral membrane protein MurJ [candidate division Zixibacteria bacterium]
MSTGSTTKKSFIGSAGTVSSATAFSRILGLVREQVMAWFFGAGMATDAFVTAFRIPNLLRDMFAEGALSAAFVPVFKEKLVKTTEQDAFHLANVVATAILLLVGAIVLLGILAAPVLIYITANGFIDTPDKFNLTVSLTRIMMVYLLLVSLSALIMGMLNSFGRFAIPALSPAMFNIGVVLSVILLYKGFNQPVYSLAIGVVIGGIGQLVIQLPSLLQIGFRFRPVLDLFDEGLRKVVRLITPMIIGMSAGRVNILLSTLLASFLVEGSISYLNYSYRLMHFPLGVFAVALGTVTLPRVSEMVARGDREGLRVAFREAIDLNLLVVVPSAFFLALLGDEVVSLIYQWGRFNEANAANTSLALLHYSYGLIGFAAVRVTVPFFYAHGDSKLPMRVSIISVIVNMALYYPLIKLLNFAGLAAATSIAGLLNFALLLYYLPTKGIAVPWRELTIKSAKIVAAAAIAFLIADYLPVITVEGIGAVGQRLLNLALPTAVAGVLYIVLCLLLGIGEIKRLLNMVLPGKRPGA